MQFESSRTFLQTRLLYRNSSYKRELDKSLISNQNGYFVHDFYFEMNVINFFNLNNIFSKEIENKKFIILKNIRDNSYRFVFADFDKKDKDQILTIHYFRNLAYPSLANYENSLFYVLSFNEWRSNNSNDYNWDDLIMLCYGNYFISTRGGYYQFGYNVIRKKHFFNYRIITQDKIILWFMDNFVNVTELLGNGTIDKKNLIYII